MLKSGPDRSESAYVISRSNVDSILSIWINSGAVESVWSTLHRDLGEPLAIVTIESSKPDGFKGYQVAGIGQFRNGTVVFQSAIEVLNTGAVQPDTLLNMLYAVISDDEFGSIADGFELREQLSDSGSLQILGGYAHPEQMDPNILVAILNSDTSVYYSRRYSYLPTLKKMLQSEFDTRSVSREDQLFLFVDSSLERYRDNLRPLDD